MNSETDAELNSISEVLKPCDHNGKHEPDTPLNYQSSYQMQINQYRNKHKKLSTIKTKQSVTVKKQPSPTHRHTHNQANPAAAILVIGYSMVKHLQQGLATFSERGPDETFRSSSWAGMKTRKPQNEDVYYNTFIAKQANQRDGWCCLP